MRSVRPIGVLALLLVVCDIAAAAAARPLPKIRVSPDGRTFADENGKPFVPFGVNYYRPGTGWAPQVWKTFDAEVTRKDFARMKELGVNCVRIFLTYHSFHTNPGVLNPEGIEKFDRFLSIAEDVGIYVHPAGPEFWEGPPNWKPVAIAHEGTLAANEKFWRAFAARYRGRNVIWAYDLKNEPDVGWKLDIIKPQWNEWLKKRYGSVEKLQAAWATPSTRTTNGAASSPSTPLAGERRSLAFGDIPIPASKNAFKSRELLDFQSFREHIADEWTRRQAEAIKASDPDALVTVGCLQTSVPSRFWGGIEDYTGFRPERQAKFLDFLEIHFYPSEGGGYEYKTKAGELANMAYLEGIVREVARPGKPVVLAEFGWYGGAEKPKFDKGAHPQASEQQQAEYCRHVVETTSGFVVGWLNWGLYDHPGATDCSELTGLLTADGKTKAWGKTFHQLSTDFSGKHIAPKQIGLRPSLDWDACLTSAAATKEFRDQYRQAFLAEQRP
jgi:endo-1,4-beta-mannosidase